MERKKIILILHIFCLSILVKGQHPWLIKDINTTGPSTYTYLGYNTLNNGTDVGSIGIYGLGNTANQAPRSFYNINGKILFFGSDDKSNSGLFVTDGTSSGTQFIAAVAILNTTFGISGVYKTDKLLYFTTHENGTSSPYGWSLWRSDGTATGTFKIYNGTATTSVVNGSINIENCSATLLNGNFYFFTGESSNNQNYGRIYKTDGTLSGTSVFFTAAANTSLGGHIIGFNNKIYFDYNNYSGLPSQINYGYEIFSSDGINTQMICDFSPGSASSTISQWVNLNDKYLIISGTFPGAGGVNIIRLKSGDNCPLALFNPGVINSISLYLGEKLSYGSPSINSAYILNDRLFFVATLLSTNKSKTFVTNGEANGTINMSNLETSSNGGTNYIGFTSSGLVFSYYSSLSDYPKVYKWDGISATSNKILTDSLQGDILAVSPLYSCYQLKEKLIFFDLSKNFIYQTDTAGSYCYRIMRGLSIKGRGDTLNNVIIAPMLNLIGYQAGEEPHKISPDNLQIWTGSISSDWTNINNWLSKTLPNSNSDIIIPATLNSPVLNTSSSCNSVSVIGANLYDQIKGQYVFCNTATTINKPGNLIINGFINNLGFINGTGSLKITGSGNGQILTFGCDALSYVSSNSFVSTINVDTVNINGANWDVTNVNNTTPNYFKLNSVVSFSSPNNIINNKSILYLLRKPIGFNSSNFIFDNRNQGTSLYYSIPPTTLDTSGTIPIGSRTNSYNPVNITYPVSAALSTNYQANAVVQDSVKKNGLTGLRLDSNVVKKTWTISGGNASKIKLGWQGIDEGINFNRNKCTILIYANSVWKALGGYQSAIFINGTYYLEQSFNPTSFNGQFIIADSVLAVALVGNLIAPAISISPSVNGVCSGTSVTFSAIITNAGTGPIFQWLKNGLGVGTNSSTYTDNTFTNGDIVSCILTSTAGVGTFLNRITSNNVALNILGNTPPTITISPNVSAVCAGTAVTFTATITNGGTTPAYQWKKNGVNVGTNIAQYVDNTLQLADTITCVLTSNSSCATAITATSNKSAVNVYPIPAATINASGSGSICTGGNIILTASPAVSYQWNLNGSPIPGATKSVDTATIQGSYTITVINANNCSATSSPFTVTINTPPITPTISSKGPISFCAGSGDTLVSSAAGVNQWYLNGAAISNAVSSTYVVTTSGSYSVSSSNIGCQSNPSSPITITVNAAPAVPVITSTGPLSFCVGSNILLTSSSAIGNQWYKDGAIIGNATGSSYSATASGIYTDSVTNTAGCKSGSVANTVTVIALPSIPVITPGGPFTLCSGSSIILTASSGTGNQWYKDGTILTGATSASYSATLAGVYTDSVTNSGGCKAGSAGTTVTTQASPVVPVISASGPTTFCSGGSVLLSSGASGNNQWYNNGVIIATANGTTYTATTSGNYTDSVTNSNGCKSGSAVTAVSAIVVATPTIAQQADTLISSASSGNQWYLNATTLTGATNQKYKILNTGTYTVQVTGTNGCLSSMSANFPVIITAVNNITNNSTDWKLYPNPVTGGILFIRKMGNNIGGTVTAQITTVAGRVVGNKTISAAGEWNIAFLPAGVYYLRIMDKKTIYIYQFIKQ